MSYWDKHTKQEIKKEPPKEPKILSGTVYHPDKGTYQVYFSEDELLSGKNPPIQSPTEEREPLPDSPFSIYKDDQKNDLLNAYYQKMVEWGIPTVLEQEYAFREAEIRLLNDTPLHPISLSKNTPGFIYHDSYLNIFPDIVKNAWTPQLQKGYKLAILRKLPWMIHKDKFQVLQKPDSPQLSLL